MKIRTLPSVFCLSALLAAGCTSGSKETSEEQPIIGTRTVKILEQDGSKFKDLNKNGKLDPYEDWRLSPVERSRDLLSQMTLEEKAGMMLIACV